MSSLLSYWATWMHLSGSILGLLLYVFSTHALQQRRHPAAALSWILCFFFVPYIALPAYIAFGQRKIKPPTRGLDAEPIQGSTPHRQHWISTMLSSMGASPARMAEGIALHADGQEAETALWRIIEGAQARLYVSTYVLGDDRIGGQLLVRLAERARAGVDVRLLLDGVGCLTVRRHRLGELLAAGGQVARAFPPMRRLLKRQSNFRNHRKLVVADASSLWMGGRNFADEYFGGAAGDAPWQDLSLHAGGDIASDADALFRSDWQLATDERLSPLDAAGVPQAPVRPLPTSGDATGAVSASGEPAGAVAPQAQLLGSGPDQPQDALQALLVTGCFRAQRRILAATPYLIPDPVLLQALTLAARRGVRVDIVLPERSNHRLADHARSRAIRELAMAGVNIWMSTAMIHGKAVVFDDIGITGSANLDARSLFLNFELTLVLYEPLIAQQLATWIETQTMASTHFQPRPASIARDLYEGAVLWLGFQL